MQKVFFVSGIFLLVFILIFTVSCSITVSSGIQWSSSNEKIFKVDVRNNLNQSIIVNINGYLLPKLSPDETSELYKIHIFELTGLYIAIILPEDSSGLLEIQTSKKQEENAVFHISIDSVISDTFTYSITEESKTVLP
ncbi:MAG: hypothetical protein GXP33_07830 [Spirochaetes bacterium]|nr:hypothetical protein [Spirochaetota bacterium]